MIAGVVEASTGRKGIVSHVVSLFLWVAIKILQDFWTSLGVDVDCESEFPALNIWHLKISMGL